MALPRNRALRLLYQFYFRRVLPRIGRLISRHATAYTWLPASTQTFPDSPALARRMAAQGFTEVSYELFMGGVCAMHVGTRPALPRRPV
jgi:demethylmenaquinone methyltransferase/2-methoxy-6-polyprenyl-1,4-benzoquinol methylase